MPAEPAGLPLPGRPQRRARSARLRRRLSRLLELVLERLAELAHLGIDDVDACLLYTSDAADERSRADLGGRRLIKTKKNKKKTNRDRIET